MAFSYSPKIVTDGLVLYLDAANPYSYVSGSTNWNDLSRSQVSGSLINGPTFNSTNGGGIVFDGINDYVATNFLIPSGNTSKTMEVCFKLSSLKNQYIAFGGSTVNGGMFGLIVWLNQFMFWGYNVDLTSTITPLINTTYCVTIVYDSTQTKMFLYINSVLNNSVVQTLNTVNGNPLAIANTIFSDATIYSTKVYNRALSASEVLQNYNATKTRFGL